MTQQAEAPSRAALGVLYLTVFIDLVGFGIMIPFLPFYASALGASGFGLGLLLTSYSIGQLAGSFALGLLSDRVGRRPVVLLALGGAAIGMVASGVATTLLALCAARALAGVFGGSHTAAQAYVADVTEPDDRPRAMGRIGAAIGLGFVVGPAIGAGLQAVLGFGFAGAAFAAAGLAAVNLVGAALLLPEPRRLRATRRASPSAARTRHPDFGPILLASFVTSFALVSVETTLALLGKDRHGMDVRDVGLALVCMGVMFIAVQAGLIGWLSARYPLRRVACLADVVIGAALLCVAGSCSAAGLTGALALLAGAQGLAQPALAALVSQVSHADHQGTAFGVKQSLAALARTVGPVIAGALYDLHYLAPYALGAALVTTGGLFVARTRAAAAA